MSKVVSQSGKSRRNIRQLKRTPAYRRNESSYREFREKFRVSLSVWKDIGSAVVRSKKQMSMFAWNEQLTLFWYSTLYCNVKVFMRKLLILSWSFMTKNKSRINNIWIHFNVRNYGYKKIYNERITQKKIKLFFS